MTENVRPLPTRVAGEIVEPEQPSGGALAKLLPVDAELIRLRIHQIEALKRDLMQEGVHYGTIPGVKKPSLWQAGAEFLGLMFQLDASIEVERESYTDDTGWPCFRAVSHVTIRHTPSGMVVGTADGEADTGEERYRWHRTYDTEEWNATPEPYRRETQKGKRGGQQWKEKQLRTHASDLRNTIIQMATKRGYVAGMKRATATSAMFTQDVEDLPPGLRGDDREAPRASAPQQQAKAKSKPAASSPTPTAAAPTEEPGNGCIPPNQVKNILSLGALADFTDEEFRALIEEEIGSTLEEIPAADYVRRYKQARDMARGLASTAAAEK